MGISPINVSLSKGDALGEMPADTPWQAELSDMGEPWVAAIHMTCTGGYMQEIPSFDIQLSCFIRHHALYGANTDAIPNSQFKATFIANHVLSLYSTDMCIP